MTLTRVPGSVRVALVALVLLLAGGCSTAVDGAAVAGSVVSSSASSPMVSSPAPSPTAAPSPITITPPPTAQTSTAESASSPSPSSATSDTSTESTATSTSAAEPGQAGKSWQSPSGNIRCTTSGVDPVTCVITTIDFAGPAGCASGPVAVSLPREGNRVIGCASGTEVEQSPEALGYGQSISDGPVTCSSAETGMTCENSSSGAGFALSRSGITTPGEVLVLTPSGLGAITMGMTMDQVKAVAPEFVVESAGGLGAGCGSGSLPYASLLFNPDGTLSLISNIQGKVRTEDGLTLGDPASKIVDLYGDKVDIFGDGSGSWLGVQLDKAAGLNYWVFTDFQGFAYEGDDPMTPDAKVTMLALNRDQQCVS